MIKVMDASEEHIESPYLKLLSQIMDQGSDRDDRTKTGTISLFGAMMKFDLRRGFPLLTTKKVNFSAIVKELLWFISGSTDSQKLEHQGVNIWKGNSSADFLQKRGLNYEPGQIGPSYGHQWRNCGGIYSGNSEGHTAPNQTENFQTPGVDQLKNVIESIKKDPCSRRHIVSSWDVVNIDKMALPPCHCMFQFYVDGKYLDCMLYQRSGDMFLGIPFNIASYSLLMLIIAKLTNLVPRYFTHVIGDAHIYNNHLEQVKVQLSRSPLEPPQVTISDDITDIDSVKLEHIELINYKSHPYIKADMAV